MKKRLVLLVQHGTLTTHVHFVSMMIQLNELLAEMPKTITLHLTSNACFPTAENLKQSLADTFELENLGIAKVPLERNLANAGNFIKNLSLREPIVICVTSLPIHGLLKEIDIIPPEQEVSFIFCDLEEGKILKRDSAPVTNTV